mmetsp:Transcript_38627/g.106388  ORF Transcript_38627/g.106388 Transcript_38627/m.106388 type:complete len:274 (-) Transcript_38627:165-986(-)
MAENADGGPMMGNGNGFGGKSVSDMHAAWAANGCVEFTPGAFQNPNIAPAGRGNTVPNKPHALAGMPGPVGMGMNVGMLPGAPGGSGPPMVNTGYGPMHQGHWPPMVPQMPGTWGQGLSGMVPDAPWLGAQSAGMQHLDQAYSVPQVDMRHGKHVPAPAQPSQMTPVIAWNLSPTYTKQDLADALVEIDFLPEKLVACSDLQKGTFLLYYTETWLANALVISLDDTRGHLKDNGEPVRLAAWNNDIAGWSSKAVPKLLQQELPARIKSDIHGG